MFCTWSSSIIWDWNAGYCEILSGTTSKVCWGKGTRHQHITLTPALDWGSDNFGAITKPPWGGVGTASSNKYGSRARSCAVVRGRAWSCVVVRGRARRSCVAVVRGRAWSCVVVRGRAWSCVVVRGHACSCATVVRGHAWSCVVVRGRAWSCVVVRGRAWSVVRCRACVVVRAWSCAVRRVWSCVVVRGRARSCAVVRGRARWSCVVVRGRAWSCVVVILCRTAAIYRTKEVAHARTPPSSGWSEGKETNQLTKVHWIDNPLNPPGLGWVEFV